MIAKLKKASMPRKYRRSKKKFRRRPYRRRRRSYRLIPRSFPFGQRKVVSHKYVERTIDLNPGIGGVLVIQCVSLMVIFVQARLFNMFSALMGTV